MNSLACVAGSFLGEIFVCRSYLYSPARSNKKNDAFSPRPSPHCFLVQPQFSFCAVYLLIYEPQKKKQKTPSMQAMNSETKVKLKLVMRISS